VLVEVLVKPGSKRPGISEEDGRLVVRVRERAIEGAANEACVRALAAAYAVAPSAVTLVRGVRARRKRFEIDVPGDSEAFGRHRRMRPAQ
jgi:uncharacterized protein